MESNQTEAVVARPVSENERIDTLDVLRGFALFGIMFVNVSGFNSPADWFFIDWANIGAAETVVEQLKLFFTQGKFYSLFAFLFGVGFAVQLASAERRGNVFWARFLWRSLVLLGIGLFHLVFIWEGDILNSYAMGALFLLIAFGIKRLLDLVVRKVSKTRDKAPRWLAIVGAVFLMYGPMVGWGMFVKQNLDFEEKATSGVELNEQEQKRWDMIQKRKEEGPKRQIERREKLTETFATGTFGDTLEYRQSIWKRRYGSVNFWFTVGGLFLIGAYFGRNNYIGRAQELKSGFKKLLIITAVIGTPLSALFVWANMQSATQVGVQWGFFNFLSKQTSGITFALMYVAAFSLMMIGPMKSKLTFLAPVGRMALTNYLSQSVLGTFVFYGWGLGLMGKVNAIEQLFYIAAVFTAQVFFSKWWLTKYNFGPVEWLWRSITYLKLQPMVKEQEKLSPAPSQA